MKSCLLPYKESKLNMLDHLVKKGYINSDRVLQGDYYFKGKPYIERLLEDINTNYELNLSQLFEVDKTYVERPTGSPQGFKYFIPRLVPLDYAFNQIDTKRQELGIYENRMSIGDYNKSKEATEDESIKPGVLELFEENPELSSIGTPEEYSQYLESLNKPNTNPILQGNQANIEEIITQLEKEGLLEIDCKGKLKAEKGLATSFVKGGKWKVIKDLKGYPTHKEGGVDLTIGKGGVSIKNGNTQFTAKYGLVIPKN